MNTNLESPANARAITLWDFWTAVPDSSLAFEASGAGATEMPVWRVNLPADSRAAEKVLGQGERRWSRVDSALDQALVRLASFQASTRDGQAAPGGTVSFDAQAAQALPAPERNLLEMLQGVEQAQLPASYGLMEDVAGRLGWGQAAQEFQSFLDRLTQTLAFYAWVETNVEGRLLGRTAVTWTGDMRTNWREGLDATQAKLHYRTLALALASRNSLLRTISLASRGALMLATLPALLATPGGALVALPAAWKFINQVLEELDRNEPFQN